MTRKHLITLGTAIAISAVLWTTAHAENSGQVINGYPAIASLKSKGARIGYHRATGRVNFVGFGAGKAVLAMGAAPGLQAQQNAMAVLQQYAPLFGIKSPGTDLQLMKQFTRENGRAMVRYQQVYKGLPVIGAELIVNLDDRGRMLSLNGEASTKLALSVTAERSPSQAVETALASVAKHHQLAVTSLSASEPVLSVYDPRLLGPNSYPSSLVWQLEVTANSLAPVREYVLVDAIRGNIVLQFNQVHQLKRRNTYDAGGTDILPGTLVCNESNGDACTSGTNVEADFAHRYAGDTYDFYMTNHARDSLDGAGMVMNSTVNYSYPKCPNAFWNGNQMVYCLGLPQGDDVVSHELTHGVTENTSNLLYFYQSGAINESLSDVWGEFVDLTNGAGDDSPAVRWAVGEDSVLGVIRDMSDPTANGDPDKMTSSNYDYDVNFFDNGGVHTNSGINNKAVYLMVDGGIFNGQTIASMGITKVAKIYYEVQTTQLTSGSDYLDLYNGLYQACQNLVGTAGVTSGDCTNVRNATLAVEMHLEPSAGYNPEAAVCPDGYSPVNSFYDDIESGLGKWAFSHDGAMANINWVDWYAAYPSNPYASSGLHSLIGFDIDALSDQYARISTTVSNVSGHTPYLHFKHAYMFEFGSYDGGVLEYSINGGSTWIDAGSLIESGRDYSGTVGNLFSNPLGGRSAYVNTSHGYVSTRLDLSTFAGQAIDLRWRVGTDSGVGAFGWWLDDVRVYHCNRAPVASAQGLATDEDTGLAITLTGSDVDGDSISYSISAAPANGTLSGAAPNLTYTPNPNYFGSDSFSYTVDDGAGGTDTAVISITVNSVNDAPGAATLVTPADSATDVDPASVAFKWQPATDVDGDTVSYELKVCKDAGFNTGCNSVIVASLQANILIAGIGGGSLLLLGVAGMSLRRKQLVWAIPLYITIALLAACSSGSSSDPVFIDTSINATVDGLTPGIDYYWKVTTSDGNTGVTDSSVWMFTTTP